MATNPNVLTPAAVAAMATRHEWAATGVSDYPPRDPLVGQSRFFKRYRTFIHTVDTAAGVIGLCVGGEQIRTFL